MKRLLSGVIFFTAFGLSFTSLWASKPSDLFQIGQRAKSTAGSSGITMPSGPDATVNNPAALTHIPGIVAGFSYSYGYMGLAVNGKDANVLDYRGFDLGIALSLPQLFGKKISLGLTVHLPDQMILRMQAIPASEPRFIRFDNYPHRLETAAALAFAPLDWLSIGLGAAIMMDFDGEEFHLKVGSKSGQKIGEMEISSSIPYRIIPFGGLIITPKHLPFLRKCKLGFFYREPYHFNLNMNVMADVDVAGIVTGDTIIALRMHDHFSPRKLRAGIAFNFFEKHNLFFDLSWEQWSQFDAGFSTMKILVDLGINPPLVEAILPDDNFRDILTFSGGLELVFQKVMLRAGYGYHPTPVPNQVGFSTLMDNNRHVFAAGMGFDFKGPAILPYPVQFGLSYQLHYLVSRTARKNNSTLPSVQYGGSIHHLSIGFKMDF